ncbi:branched-chain amino acid ABC transporter permease [Hoeflea sp.]|uniref:branched-chain amino acid ABC transporter permease n=1 Tax=Hoeflea sp. TaxID=1940281 RepID=UPI003B02234C
MESSPQPAVSDLASSPRRIMPIVEVLLLGILLVVPLFVSDFLTIIITRMLILALLAISFDLCWGYSGIMTFGQALYFGMAGYAVALLANKAGFQQFWGVIVVGMLVGLIVSLLIAWFLLLGKKRPEIIFVALGTLTASYAAERLVAGWEWVGAGNGMAVYGFLQAGTYELEPGLVFYYIAAAILLAVYLTSRYLVRSQFGLVLAGIRQNEDRLAFFGYRIQEFKALIFSFAGMIAGLSGALYTYHEGFVGPGSMGITLSTFAVLYGLFGGAGTLVGPIIGVFLIEGISFTLSDVDEVRSFWPIILGFIMLIVVTYKTNGVMGFVLSQRERIGTFGVAKETKVFSQSKDDGKKNASS